MRKVVRAVTLVVMAAIAASHTAARTPSGTSPDAPAPAIRADRNLSAAESTTNAGYVSAMANTDKRGKSKLQTEQRTWRARLMQCGETAQPDQCRAARFANRTVELQARYRLVPSKGPVELACTDGSRMSVRYFDTAPPSLIAERGDQQSLMLQKPSASGARYGGPIDSLWEHQGRFRIAWSKAGKDLDCGVI